MCHVKCLKKIQIDYKILCLFYNSVISRVLTYGIPCWFAGCHKKLKKSINRFPKKMSKLVDSKVGFLIKQPVVILETKCFKLLLKAVADDVYPLHGCVSILPPGRSKMLLCRSRKFHDSFLPTASGHF